MRLTSTQKKLSVIGSGLFLAVFLLLVSACGARGSGEDATLGVYFQKMSHVNNAMETRVENEELPAAILNNYQGYVSDLENLDYPEEVELIHRNGVDRGRRAVEQIMALIRATESGDPDGQLGEISLAIDEELTRMTETCNDLQLIATQDDLLDDSGALYDLRCDMHHSAKDYLSD